MSEETKKKVDRLNVIMAIVIAILAIVTIVIALIINGAENSKMDKIRDAVKYACTDDVNEDYIMTITRCESRAADCPGAEYYLVYMYTDEDGMEVMYVRYYEERAEVFKQ